MAGWSHVTLVTDAGAQGESGRDPTAERGRGGTNGGAGITIWLSRLTILAVCEPIGGGNQVPTSATGRRSPPNTDLCEGEGNCPCRKQGSSYRTRRAVRRAQIGLSDRSSGRAINSEGINSHGFNAFFVGKGSGKPLDGPENCLTRVNRFYLWKGKGVGAYHEASRTCNPVWYCTSLIDNQLVPSGLDEYSTQSSISAGVTMKLHTYHLFC